MAQTHKILTRFVQVGLRNVCCFNIPHLQREWRHAVKRVRRRPRLITSVFRGAKL
jgi:hypothetical protein